MGCGGSTLPATEDVMVAKANSAAPAPSAPAVKSESAPATEPPTGEPAAYEPAATEPTVQSAVAEEPAAAEPAAVEPAAEESAAEVAEEPAAAEPAAVEPAAEESAAEEPVAEEPAPATEEPAPAAEEPATAVDAAVYAETEAVAPAPKKRKPIVGANWKCNPDSKSKLDELIANINLCDTSACEVYVCPSTLHVDYCADKFSNGAMVTPQNCNFKGCGAYTGEMSVEQMKDFGVTNVLLGHSERRGEFGILPMDDNSTLALKLRYVLDAGMRCVYCIGEPLPIRQQGLEAVLAEMAKQLLPVKDMLDADKVVLAYEPVWAIGTGETASPEQAQETHAGIRKWIADNVSPECADAIRIQYGGSANAKNAPDLSAQPDIDGFLVGGASLKPEFAEIVAAISSAKA